MSTFAKRHIAWWQRKRTCGCVLLFNNVLVFVSSVLISWYWVLKVIWSKFTPYCYFFLLSDLNVKGFCIWLNDAEGILQDDYCIQQIQRNTINMTLNELFRVFDFIFFHACVVDYCFCLFSRLPFCCLCVWCLSVCFLCLLDWTVHSLLQQKAISWTDLSGCAFIRY